MMKTRINGQVVGGLLVVCALVATARGQGIIYVNGTTGNDNWTGRCEVWDGGTCGPKRTIQAGIDVCGSDEFVLVADGTYTGERNKNLQVSGHPRRVQSANGAEACIIDCEGQGRGFRFRWNVSGNSVIDGFTIQNGYVDEEAPGGAYGAGILCENQNNVTISSCTITSNHTTRGGGVCCRDDTSLRMVNCIVSFNTAAYGGGVYCDEARIVMDGTIVRDNVASWGGGVYCVEAGIVMDGTTVTDNVASGAGGGVYARGSTVRGGTIMDNAAGYGGGMYATRGSDPSPSNSAVSNCVIRGNHTTNILYGDGGGIEFSNGPVTLKNCLIAENFAIGNGGGVSVSCVGYSGVIINCTIVDNCAVFIGGGICNSGARALSLWDCIVWDNVAGLGPELAVPHCVSGETILRVAYCDVQGGVAAAYVGAGSFLHWGLGNIDMDPRFWDPPNGDYHLMPDSPCIEAGDPGFVTHPGETDIDGQYRVWNGRVDMGVDEHGSPETVLGDLNCDATLDAFDIDPFVLALTDEETYYAAHPNGIHMLADINGDGVVDAFDIDPFVELLIGG